MFHLSFQRYLPPNATIWLFVQSSQFYKPVDPFCGIDECHMPKIHSFLYCKTIYAPVTVLAACLQPPLKVVSFVCDIHIRGKDSKGSGTVRWCQIVVLIAFILLIRGILAGGRAPTKGTAEQHFDQGNKLVEQGRYNEAITEFTRAIELDPNMAVSYSNRAGSYNEKGEYDLAIADCNKAIELDPRLAMAYSNRACAYNEIGEYDLVIADCNKAIELDPNVVLAYVNRSTACFYQKQYDLAITDCNKAIELDPNMAMAYNNRAWGYKLQGKKAEALADFEKLITLTHNAAFILMARQQIDELSK